MISELDLNQRILAAREYEQTIGALTFRLRIPSRLEARGTWRAIGYDEGALERFVGSCKLLETALVSVRGATTRDVGLEGEPQPLPETAGAARACIADRPELAEELHGELMRRMKERNERLDALEKNS